MSVPMPVTIDFETFGIQARPQYPPIPVGVAIKYYGEGGRYYAFGHPKDNNCSYTEACTALEKAYEHPDGVLFHNGKFDLDVADVHLGMRIPDWKRTHDTLYLLYLNDPHQIDLGLKPSAELILGIPPTERDEIGDWLVEHQPIAGVKISRSRNSEHYYARYIAYAPTELVSKYAVSDVEMTEGLFTLLYPNIVERDMLGAYDRERELMPILLTMERQGLPIDVKRLGDDIATYEAVRTRLDKWVLRRIKAPVGCNLDSGAQLVEAMIASGRVDETLMPRTPTGKIKSDKASLLLGVNDKVLLAVLKYRTQLNTCMNTFMLPWYATASESKGLIYNTWHQTKVPRGDGSVGTRTGRLSSTPNFQNIPKLFKPIFRHEVVGSKLPICPFKVPPLPALPDVRSYIIPFDGHVLIDRDYSQQEPRILAHFDGGSLMQGYLDDPWMDVHDYARAELVKVGLIYDRGRVKNTNLGLIYGMGAGALAALNDMTVQEATVLKKALLALYPGLREMYKAMRVHARQHTPIRTWGGREYYCEEPKLVDGRLREFDYKMVNVLIQGSAADCTKEAIIRYARVKHPDARIVLNVHDQITVSVPVKHRVSEMTLLRISMESVEFDVPMLTDGCTATETWGALVPYDKKGVKL